MADSEQLGLAFAAPQRKVYAVRELVAALRTQVEAAALGAQRVKGRDAPVYAYKIDKVGE